MPIELPPSAELWLPPKPAIIRPADARPAILFPVVPPLVSSASPSLYSGGSNIGNMSFGGNVGAAFDNNTSQNPAAGARGLQPGPVYVGKDHGSAAKRVFYAEVYPCIAGADPAGFENDGSVVTLTLYVKTSVPSGPTDGTAVATNAGVAGNSSAVMNTLTCSDQSTLFRCFWVAFSAGGSGGSFYCAEVKFYVV